MPLCSQRVIDFTPMSLGYNILYHTLFRHTCFKTHNYIACHKYQAVNQVLSFPD